MQEQFAMAQQYNMPRSALNGRRQKDQAQFDNYKRKKLRREMIFGAKNQ